MSVGHRILRELRAMLDELESHRLTVALVPCRRFVNEGGCVRVAVEKNAQWYRDFCARHASARVRRNAAFDTRIRRANIIRALDAMIEGQMTSVYSLELLGIARTRIDKAAQPSSRAMTMRLFSIA